MNNSIKHQFFNKFRINENLIFVFFFFKKKHIIYTNNFRFKQKISFNELSLNQNVGTFRNLIFFKTF